MKTSWVVIFNRLFAIIDVRGDRYFSGGRFINKVREIDPYFPEYKELIAERNRTGKSTSRRSYFYDILLSLGEEQRLRLLNSILADIEKGAEEQVCEIRGLVHGVTLAPSATVHSTAWSAERLNEYLTEIDNCIAASNYARAVTLSYTCLEGLYKAFVREKLPDKSGSTELIELSREIKTILAATVKNYPPEAFTMITHISHTVDRARNKFSESHFEAEPARWLATYVRDLVNTQIRLLLNFMKS